MKIRTRRLISLVAALTLLLTCVISGLVLPAAAASGNDNILANGDFESGATSWENATYFVSGQGKDGGTGYYHNRTETGEWDATGQVRYKAALLSKLEAGEQYVLTFDYKTSGTALGQFYFDVSCGTTATGELKQGYDLPSGVTEWAQQSVVFTAPSSLANANTGWEFSIRARGGVGEVWYDNFSLTKYTAAAPATPTTTGSLKIDNFEGDVSAWKYGGAAVTAIADGDNKVMALSDKGKFLTGSFADVNLEANVQYLIRFKVKNVAGKKARLMCAIYKADGGYDAPYTDVSATDAADWTYYQFSYTPTEAKTGASFGFYMENSASTEDGAKLYIDDAELIKVSEETNLVAGADMASASQAFKTFYGKGATIVNDTVDTNNKVMHIPVGQTDVWCNFVGLKANSLYEVSFRYRGGSIAHYFNDSYSSRLELVSGGAASEDWTTYKMYLWAKTGDPAWSLMLRTDAGNGSKELWIDDFSLRQVSLELNKTETSIAAGSNETLTVTAKPTGVQVPELTWTSDAESIATVDATGKVTAVAAGTANIKATAGPITLTCAVTVTAAGGSGDPEPSTPTTPSNLLTNGDFESGAVAPWTTLGDYTIEDGKGFGGSKGLVIPAHEGNKVVYAKGLNAALPLEANTTYVLTYMSKGPAMRIWLGNTTDITGGSLSSTPYNSDWTIHHMIIKAGANPSWNDGWSMTIESNSTTTEPTYVDNIVVTKASEADFGFGGDFDVLSYMHWNNLLTGGNALVVTEAGGNKALKIEASKAFENYMKNVSLLPNTTYVVSFKAKGAPISLYLNGAYATGENAGKWLATENTTDYQEYSYTFTTTGTYDAHWAFDWKRAAATTDTYLDDFSIVQGRAPDATAVALDKESVLLGVNDTAQLTASTTPINSSYESLTFSSNNETVATVDNTGKITSHAVGDATITATLKVNATTSFTATCAVKVVVPATDFTIQQTTLHLAPNTEANRRVYDTLKVTSIPENTYTGNITWSSNNESVATVDANGKVTAIAAGTATITGTLGSVSHTVAVTVDAQGERFTGGDFEGDDWNNERWTNSIIAAGKGEVVTENGNSFLKIPTTMTSAGWVWPSLVNPGRTYKLTFKAKNADGIATMHFTGAYVSAGATGWAKKEISTTDWEEVTYIFTTVSVDLNKNYLIGFGQQSGFNHSDLYIDDISLVEMPMATSMTLADTELKVGATASLAPVVTPENYSTGKLTWESSDPAVIKVDGNGKVTAVAGEGEVTVTVTSTEDASLTAQAKVTIVGDYATSLTLNRNTLYLGKGATAQLIKTLSPAGSRYKAITWTSSDDTIAMVDQDGLVTAAADKTGTATITVKSGDLTATCTVVVMPPATSFELADEAIKLGTPGGSLKVSKTLSIVTTPAHSDYGAVTWSSSNDDIASVDENGKVTAHAAGTATISLSKDGNVVDTCEVTVAWDGERIVGGSFDDDDWNIPDWTNNLIKDGRGSVVTDPADENNMVMALPNDNNKLDALWISNLKVNAAKAYKMTFKVKGDGTASQQLAVYFHGTSVNLNGWKYVGSLTTEWQTVTYIFQTNALDDGTSAAINRNYCIGFDNNRTGNIYFDDFSLVELPDATNLEIVSQTDTVELWPEGSTTLSFKTEPAEAGTGKVTWSSSDENIVTVDQNGKVTAVAASGTATITATSELGLTATISVKVTEYANLLPNGDFEQGSLYWPDHANVQTGVGKDGGYAMVLPAGGAGVKTDYFYKGTLALNPGTTYIVEWDYLASTDASFRLWAGNIGMQSSAKEGDGTTWQHASTIFTTPASMVEINNNLYKGWIFSVTHDKGGLTPSYVDNITLRLYDSGVKAESIKLSHETLTLMPGRTQGLQVIATPTEGNVNGMVWSSDNEDIATVEYGIVTAIGKGTATITATKTYDDGKTVTATCEVTVSGEEAFIKNGTFEKPTTGNWTTSGSAAIESGVGVNKTSAAAISGDGKFTYSIANLKSNKTYNLYIRYRAASSGKLGMSLMNGEVDLLGGKTVSADSSWVKASYEIKTETLAENTTEFTLQVAEGNGPIYVDHVFLVEAVTAIDFVVEGMVWDNNEQVVPGTELQFFVTITNQGEDPVPAGSTIDIDVCVDSQSVMRFPYTFNSVFATGDRVMVESPDKWAAVKGDHVVSARVNSTLKILEINPDNNNTVQTDLRVNETILEAPEIAQQAGFTTLGFSDDFESLSTIDTTASCRDGYKWYVTRPYGSSTVTPDAYSIEGSVLTIKDKVPTYNMSLSSVDYKSGIGYQWNKGYIETYIRIPRPRENAEGETGIPAIWSLPVEKLQGAATTQWVEMDWMEYWGITDHRPGGYYTITLHDQKTESDVQVSYNRNTNYSQEGLGDGQWHHMAWLWVQDYVIGYLDGEEVFRLNYNENTFSDPIQQIIQANEDGGVGAFSFMNEQMLVMHLGGSFDNPLEIDYLRIWTSMDGGSYVPGDDDDDDNSNVTVDMDAESFWFNFCTDDYGDPITEVTYDNYLNILAGEEVWNQLSDARRAEINAYLQSLGQPTFDELLLGAKAMKDLVDSGWTPDDDEPIDEPDEPTDDPVDEPDEPTDEPDDPDAEDNTKTGATSALPAALAVAVLVSAAALWMTRKRREA